mmetsp:Transcript_114148/g.233571  ORF Transcript_114148/g.233571 Transcript_114148/m.233571 type:complete len:140 (-) Transcript_114148:301-720(-)
MPSAAVFLKGTGALLMLHAAYSCLHYRSILQDLDLLSESGAGGGSSPAEFVESPSSSPSPGATIPPVDVYLEVALAFAVLLLGELVAMGPLQSVELVGGSGKPLSAPSHRTRDFDVYANRSKIRIGRAAAGVVVADKTK